MTTRSGRADFLSLSYLWLCTDNPPQNQMGIPVPNRRCSPTTRRSGSAPTVNTGIPIWFSGRVIGALIYAIDQNRSLIERVRFLTNKVASDRGKYYPKKRSHLIDFKKADAGTKVYETKWQRLWTRDQKCKQTLSAVLLVLPDTNLVL